jgi:hypothetical protein
VKVQQAKPEEEAKIENKDEQSAIVPKTGKLGRVAYPDTAPAAALRESLRQQYPSYTAVPQHRLPSSTLAFSF